MDVSAVLDHYSRLKKDVKFLQVGSNDGVESDPLRRFIVRDRWHGVLVEPLPDTFKTLVKNYDNYTHKGDLTFENIAVSDKNHIIPFYYIDAKKANVPEGSANKFSSFNREIPLKLKYEYPDVEKNICEIGIQTLTLDSLLTKHNLKKDLDLLHVDTEGHDYVILKQLDLKITRPDIILFENLHLTLTDYKNCARKLRDNEYILYEQGLDTLAIQHDLNDKIIKRKNPI
jgi:FkbM family methyltransferase